jgi:hypothetical protein
MASLHSWGGDAVHGNCQPLPHCEEVQLKVAWTGSGESVPVTCVKMDQPSYPFRSPAPD